jgi:hypothetical protein
MEKMMKRTPEQILDISEKVYRQRLEDDCRGNTERMLQKDREKDPDDNGKKLRNRAKSYNRLTRVYLQVLGLDEDDGA